MTKLIYSTQKNIKEEIWMPIKNYESYYEVSNLGRIRSLDRIVKNGKTTTRFQKGRVLSHRVNTKRFGYCEVSLRVNKVEKRFKVHRLVAEAFIPNIDNKPFVNHIDGNKENNSVSNLEWCTDKENKKHGWGAGLYTSDHIKKRIICNETKIEYESITDASRNIPCDRRYLQKHLQGEVKSVKGYTYSYKLNQA